MSRIVLSISLLLVLVLSTLPTMVVADPGETWAKKGVVLAPTPGAWDSSQVGAVAVIEHAVAKKAVVLAPTPGAWDSSQVGAVAVIKHTVTISSITYRYEMWYTGVGADGVPKIGYAYSTDGVNWVKHPDPVLEKRAGQGDAGAVGIPTVLFESGVYKMWYTGTDAFNMNIATGQLTFNAPKIYSATSTDGIEWTGRTLLSFGTAPTWWGAGMATPWVHKGATGYQMFFTARATGASGLGGLTIGTSASTDGTNWGTPTQVLTGTTGAYDERGVATPSIVDIGGTLIMYYTGLRGSGPSAQTAIGRATFGPTTGWVKDASPILTRGATGEWDAAQIDHPRPFCGTPFLSICGGRFMLYYSGLNQLFVGDVLNVGTSKVGYATMPVSLTGTVTLQGRGTASAATTAIQLKLYEPGATPEDMTTAGGRDTWLNTALQATANRTDNTGTFTVTVDAGLYDIRVRNPHTMRNVQRNVTLMAPTATASLGVLKEGDSNQDNRVSSLDFSALKAAYLKAKPDAKYNPQADYNEDDRVSALDFSLLKGSYLKAGDWEIP